MESLEKQPIDDSIKFCRQFDGGSTRSRGGGRDTKERTMSAWVHGRTDMVVGEERISSLIISRFKNANAHTMPYIKG